MHIALKKIYYDLQRFLSKGSDEQIKDLYFLVKEEYDKLEKVISNKEELSNDNINNGSPEVKKAGRPKKQENE